jgi:hypothetical protein
MIIDKDYIKSKFVKPYNIKEILLFIDEIDEEYNYEYKNIKIKVYYRKNKDILDINLIHTVLKRGSDIINHKSFKTQMNVLLKRVHGLLVRYTLFRNFIGIWRDKNQFSAEILSLCI